MDIKGRTVVVTGAGSGIGAACAHAFSALGAELVLVDRDGGGLTRTVDGLGGLARAVSTDVTDVEALCRLFEGLGAAGRDLAAVINAAGIVTGGDPWPTSNLNRMRRVLDINAGGTAVTTTLAATYPLTAERVVVNVASAAAIRPLPPDPAYAMSKAAVVAFTKSAAINDCGLRVNVVLPGVVDTPMLGTTGTGGVAEWLAPRLVGPLLTAQDVADAIVELVIGEHNGVAWSLEPVSDGAPTVVAV